jgi:hypothetical protein
MSKRLLVDAYLNLANPEAHERAADILSFFFLNEHSPEKRLKLVMLIVQRAQVPEHEDALGPLGAGPLEDMMGDWLLDRLQEYLPFSESLRYALSMVRMEVEPEALQQRLNAMLAVR